MAFSIKVQSKIAIEWQNYINDVDKYFEKIKEIANKENITKKDTQRIKIMLEILLKEYNLLKHSLLLPKSLKEKAEKKHQKVVKLYEKLFTNSNE